MSDRLFDALIAWGDEEAIRNRVDEHRAAGADHVCVQVLTADQNAFPREEWRRLAPALTATWRPRPRPGPALAHRAGAPGLSPGGTRWPR